jgi:spore coat polysaccharide biosynthesis predicted glycosyltransferase SpsG
VKENERVVFLIPSKEISTVENEEVKEGSFSAYRHLKETCFQLCQRSNIWEKQNIKKMNSL